MLGIPAKSVQLSSSWYHIRKRRHADLESVEKVVPQSFVSSAELKKWLLTALYCVAPRHLCFTGSHGDFFPPFSLEHYFYHRFRFLVCHAFICGNVPSSFVRMSAASFAGTRQWDGVPYHEKNKQNMAADHTPCIKQWMRREEETGHLLDSSELKDFRKLLLPTTTFPLPLPPPSISFFLLQQITNISEYIQLKNTRRLHLVVQADRSEDFKKKKNLACRKISTLVSLSEISSQ